MPPTFSKMCQHVKMSNFSLSRVSITRASSQVRAVVHTLPSDGNLVPRVFRLFGQRGNAGTEEVGHGSKGIIVGRISES